MPATKSHAVNLHTMPAIIAGPMRDETVDALSRCAPHITVIQAECGESSLLTDKPEETFGVLTPARVVSLLLDAALVLPISRGEMLSMLDGLARDIAGGSWPTTAQHLRDAYADLSRRDLDPADVPARLRAIAAPLVRFAQ